MADLCIECERLWKEYSAAMHEYLGLNRAANVATPFWIFAARPRCFANPRSDFPPRLAALREQILQHEGAAHSDAG